MKSTIMKTTVREIQESLGRYMAILAIVALGVGLYVGLTVTKPDMVAAGENYLEENKLYDLRLVSTIGYDDEAVQSLNAQEDVERSIRISSRWMKTERRASCAPIPCCGS